MLLRKYVINEALQNVVTGKPENTKICYYMDTKPGNQSTWEIFMEVGRDKKMPVEQ